MKEQTQTLSIGDVARQCAISVEALRYYERIGLLPRPARTGGGLRRYTDDVLERVRFVRQAQALGLTLRQIRALTGAGSKSSTSCRQVHDLLARHLEDIDRRMADLRHLRRTLTVYLQACERAQHRAANPKCPILSPLERPADENHHRR